MQFHPEKLYHVYNRGNNKQPIFFNRENYLFFTDKMRKHLQPVCDILSYCLMPNHFHIMVYAKADVTENAINNAIAVILRSYTRAINIQERRTGSLFQQKTKAKLLEAEGHNYPFICFNYIHQNPLKAGLVKRLEDWEFSSFSEYAGLTKRTLCNKELACNFLDLPQMGSEFYKMSYEFVDEKILERLF